ncbi:MAG TPA: zf-HC2 domain-containing protein [Burkholderiales bacterium]|nr:zf-HC2 domain-containing protein [Burkholderiales bacterium]
MDCRDIDLYLEDYLDDRLDALRHRSVHEHLQRCPSCLDRHDQALALQAALRALPAPPPRPGFLDEALARATRAPAGFLRRPVAGLALAASLALGIALGAFFAAQRGPAPEMSVALELERPQVVRLMFNSAKPLPGAILSLALPENVELVGYGARRELTWQADLRAGPNLLQLPLVAHGTPGGELVARLSHGDASKAVRVKIRLNPPGGMS